MAIVTVSDSSFSGDRRDTSGDAIRDWCDARGYEVAARSHVADETSRIAPLLASLADGGEVELILTTGGTGLAPRDVTPEATLSVIDREASGIAEYLRASTAAEFPRAVLSRGVAGVRNSTLIVNLPGSTRGVNDTLAVLERIVDHAVDVMAGIVKRHDRGTAG